MGSFSQIRTTSADNPKDNYIESYEILGNYLYVNVILKYSASFGPSSGWKLNAYLQSGAYATTLESVAIHGSNMTARIRLPEVKPGDIVRLTLTNGNTVIDKKAILIRN